MELLFLAVQRPLQAFTTSKTLERSVISFLMKVNGQHLTDKRVKMLMTMQQEDFGTE